MNTQNIPEIPFHKTAKTDIGFDIFKIRPLFSGQRKLDHPLNTPHRVSFFHIMFITEGSGQHVIDFRPYSYQPNTLLFVSKGQLQSIEPTNGLDGYMMLFTESFLLRNLSDADIPYFYRLYNHHLYDPVLSLGDHGDFSRLFADIYQEFYAIDASGRGEALQLLLKLLLIKIERIQEANTPQTRRSDWAKRFIDFKNMLEKQYQHSRRAADYAQQLAISYKHLNEICKAMAGKTVKAYITDFLTLEIKRHLVISDQSIAELSDQIGFDEPTNFVKFFKKHTGQTPAQFRKSLSS